MDRITQRISRNLGFNRRSVVSDKERLQDQAKNAENLVGNVVQSVDNLSDLGVLENEQDHTKVQKNSLVRRLRKSFRFGFGKTPLHCVQPDSRHSVGNEQQKEMSNSNLSITTTENEANCSSAKEELTLRNSDNEENEEGEEEEERVEEYNGPFQGRAIALVDCIPSPYNRYALRYKKGDLIDIVSKNPTGMWIGKMNGKVGSFKFISVKLLQNRKDEEEGGDYPEDFCGGEEGGVVKERTVDKQKEKFYQSEYSLRIEGGKRDEEESDNDDKETDYMVHHGAGRVFTSWKFDRNNYHIKLNSVPTEAVRTWRPRLINQLYTMEMEGFRFESTSFDMMTPNNFESGKVQTFHQCNSSHYKHSQGVTQNQYSTPIDKFSSTLQDSNSTTYPSLQFNGLWYPEAARTGSVRKDDKDDYNVNEFQLSMDDISFRRHSTSITNRDSGKSMMCPYAANSVSGNGETTKMQTTQERTSSAILSGSSSSCTDTSSKSFGSSEEANCVHLQALSPVLAENNFFTANKQDNMPSDGANSNANDNDDFTRKRFLQARSFFEQANTGSGSSSINKNSKKTVQKYQRKVSVVQGYDNDTAGPFPPS